MPMHPILHALLHAVPLVDPYNSRAKFHLSEGYRKKFLCTPLDLRVMPKGLMLSTVMAILRLL